MFVVAWKYPSKAKYAFEGWAHFVQGQVFTTREAAEKELADQEDLMRLYWEDQKRPERDRIKIHIWGYYKGTRFYVAEFAPAQLEKK